MTRELTSMVHQIDAQQPVAKVRTLEQVRHESLSSPRLTTILLSLFAVLALVITAFGISGVVALSVSQRTHELGVRMALGATPGNLLRMVLRQGLAPILIGVFLGIAGAVALSRVLSGLLYGVEPLDPFTYVVAAALSMVIAAVACVWPARRVTQIQPMIALRNE
jgi:putative ABC transport system permease protein